MMTIDEGNRGKWEFEYSALHLAEGAQAQKEFRLGRVAWWKEAKERVMSEIKESGVEISESVAADISNYTNTSGPQVMIRTDLQRKLTECHKKIREHQQAADVYEGWIQLLTAHKHDNLKLTQSDWLFFFGKS